MADKGSANSERADMSRFSCCQLYAVCLVRSIHNQALNFVRRESGSAFEKCQLGEDGDADDVAAELVDQLDRRLDGAAGGEKIIDDQHSLAWGYCILMDLNCIHAIFQFIVGTNRFSR